MEVDRQEELQSPMIEDFLDCDQFGTDSDADSSGSFSPQRSLKRLHIHVDMSNAHFLAPRAHHGEQPQLDGLPICTSGPTTAGFPSAELDPYSAVGLFPVSSRPGLLLSSFEAFPSSPFSCHRSPVSPLSTILLLRTQASSHPRPAPGALLSQANRVRRPAKAATTIPNRSLSQRRHPLPRTPPRCSTTTVTSSTRAARARLP